MIQEWEEQLTEMVVAFKMEKDENLPEPRLIEGDLEKVGIEEIQGFIKQLSKDVKNWRTTRCGV